MKVTNKREPFILLIGDIVCFIGSLWLMLYFRNSSGLIGGVSVETFEAHLVPFNIIFISSVLIFYISGLYEKHNSILRSKLPSIIVQAQIANSIVAIMFFYFIPYFGITPKTNLFIYLVISIILVSVWRLVVYPFLLPGKKRTAIIIGVGGEMEELIAEVNNDPHYDFTFSTIIDLAKTEHDQIFEIINQKISRSKSGENNADDISMIVIDLDHPEMKNIAPKIFDLMFSNIDFVPMYKVYEHVFNRIPYSALQHDWFIENISTTTRAVYGLGKRFLDIIVAGVAFLISLIFYPIIWIALKIQDGGPLFVTQDRVGQGYKKFKIYKFRSMKKPTSDDGAWVGQNDNRITPVGRILRKTSIDELPQLWSILKGDLSLIGPRPDLYDRGVDLSKNIPYYTIRSLIKPGLSGWAQVKQDLPPQSLEETKLRLAYDIYYVKNRSLFLDLMIVLKTIRALLLRLNQ